MKYEMWDNGRVHTHRSKNENDNFMHLKSEDGNTKEQGDTRPN